jgi:hypothetical protein
MKHFVYKTYSDVSGKYYIGRHSTDNINDGYQGSGLWVKRSRKKGNKLITEILEYSKDQKSLFKLEEKYIKKYYSDSKNTNCKLASVGMTREDVLGEKSPRYGKFHTQETKDKMSKSQMGIKPTKEVRMKLSMAKIGNKNALGNKSRLGRPHTEETKKKIGPKVRGKLNGMYGKTGLDNPFGGKHHDSETKKRIGEAVRLGWARRKERLKNKTK